MIYQVWRSEKDMAYFFDVPNLFGTLEPLLDEGGRPVCVTDREIMQNQFNNTALRIAAALERIPE